MCTVRAGMSVTGRKKSVEKMATFEAYTAGKEVNLIGHEPWRLFT